MALKLDLLQNDSRGDPWASVVTQIEGGTFQNSDANLGKLGNFAVTRLYVEAGNLLAENLSFQLGTLERFGDLGLYDMWPAEIFYDTVGVAAKYDLERFQVLVGVGDAGFQTRGSNYSTIFSSGGLVRLRFAGHLELGVGGQLRYEPQVQGNRNAPYSTPGVAYEDYLRGEVAKSWLAEHPGQELRFPNPAATSSQSYKLIGYLGFGGFGPLRWNNLFANFMRLHPKNFYTESYGGHDYTIFVKGLTDERYQVNAGNEMQIVLVPSLLDATWSMLAGYYFDQDNTLLASDDNRLFYSTVLRLQAYVTSTVHLLAETALAQEKSLQGNLYREHFNSVFKNVEDVPDPRGFEYGDTDTRSTWQLKGGVVLNPRGPGIFTRPSLRLLYGLQYSNQNQAYGNAFSESLDQYEVFSGTESHWHSVVAIEAEAWF